MRLIDADALSRALAEMWYESQISVTGISVSELINKQPTIEPTEEFEWCTDCKEYDQEKHCCHRWTKVIRETIAEIEEEYKPKRGEWIDNTSETWTPSKKCSECGLVVHSVATDSTDFHAKSKMNFCPNCGARMKGADDE